jgi:hypothetical protein
LDAFKFAIRSDGTLKDIKGALGGLDIGAMRSA